MHNVCYIHFSNPASVPGVDPISMNLLGGFGARVVQSKAWTSSKKFLGNLLRGLACKLKTRVILKTHQVQVCDLELQF
jgi:hypothetical protein